MALNNFFDIPKWRSSRHDPDAGGPVAHGALLPAQDFTQIVIAEDGQVEFCEEIPLKVHTYRFLDLTVGPKSSRRPPQLTGTIEVQGREPLVTEDDTAVISAFPYGFDWFAASRFKPYLYSGRRKGEKALRAADEVILALQVAADPQAVLDATPFDPFEQNAENLTARFVGPFERTEGSHVTVRARRGDGQNGPATKLQRSSVNRMPHEQIARRAELISVLASHFNTPRDAPPPREVLASLGLEDEAGEARRTVSPYLLFGLCRSFEECRAHLGKHAQAEKWYKDPESLLADAGLNVKRPEYELSGEVLKLYKDLAVEVLGSSIIKALAGMPRRPPSHWTKGTRRLAIDLVEVIYKDTMLNLAKRLGAKPVRKDGDGDPGLPGVEDPGLDLERFTTAEDEEKTWKERFAATPPSEARLSTAAYSMLDTDNDKQIIIICGMLAAAAPHVPISAQVITRLKQIAKEHTSDLPARGAAYALQVIADHNRPH